MEACLDAAVAQVSKNRGGAISVDPAATHLPVAIIGKTTGLNVIHPLDLSDLERSVYVPILSRHRWESDAAISLRGIMLGSALVNPSVGSPQSFVGMVAIFDLEHEISLSMLAQTHRSRIPVVLKTCELVEDLIKRGATTVPQWLICWIETRAHDRSRLQLSMSSGFVFAEVPPTQIEAIWRVTALIP